MKLRERQTVYAGMVFLLGGALLVLPGCSDSAIGPDLRDARAVVQGTVTGDGEPAADVEVTLTPFNAVCQEQLLGDAETTTTDSDGNYEVVIEREILGSSVDMCPEVEFVPPVGSGLQDVTIEGDPENLVELRAVDADIGIDTLVLDTVDLSLTS